MPADFPSREKPLLSHSLALALARARTRPRAHTHRRSRAGADRDVFTSDALSLLHKTAGGSLRAIERITTTTLRETARRKKKRVERDVMAKIVGDLGAAPGGDTNGNTRAPAVAIAGALAPLRSWPSLSPTGSAHLGNGPDHE